MGFAFDADGGAESVDPDIVHGRAQSVCVLDCRDKTVMDGKDHDPKARKPVDDLTGDFSIHAEDDHALIFKDMGFEKRVAVEEGVKDAFDQGIIDDLRIDLITSQCLLLERFTQGPNGLFSDSSVDRDHHGLLDHRARELRGKRGRKWNVVWITGELDAIEAGHDVQHLRGVIELNGFLTVDGDTGSHGAGNELPEATMLAAIDKLAIGGFMKDRVGVDMG